MNTNTNVTYLNTFFEDKNIAFEGEDAANAMFANMLIHPPKTLDERILAHAHLAVAATDEDPADEEWEEFLFLETAANDLLAALAIAPPEAVDQKIMKMASDVAHDDLKPIWGRETKSKSSFMGAEVVEVKRKVQELITNLNLAPVLFQERFLALAAADGADAPVESLRSQGGDWNLYVVSNLRNPSEKSIRLHFDGAQAHNYEDHEIELRQKDQIILHGVVKHAQVKGSIPSDLVLSPPIDLTIW